MNLQELVDELGRLLVIGSFGCNGGGADAARAAALQDVNGWRDKPASPTRTTLRASVGQILFQAAQPSAERARALAGNALRLRARSHYAREVMSLAGILPPGLSAEYCRSLALICWEQQGLTAAVALLERAARLFRDVEHLPAEVRATQQLRVVLHAEMGDFAEAVKLAQEIDAAPGHGTDRLPWLRARAALNVAFCHSALGKEEDCAAFELGLQAAESVTEEAERLYLSWLAARAWARRPNGRRVGVSKLGKLLEPAARLWPEGDVCLLLLDLCVCRTPGRQELDLHRLEKELRSAALSPAGAAAAARGLAFLRSQGFPYPGVWDMGAEAARCLRAAFRVIEPGAMRPIPFQVPWPVGAEVPVPMEA
ncbi:MAG TPA: hypothetical protein DD490_10445 [Acidobacteria bacterium]|nr:hypothetical protein [Acidobacteriota bacterium]